MQLCVSLVGFCHCCLSFPTPLLGPSLSSPPPPLLYHFAKQLQKKKQNEKGNHQFKSCSLSSEPRWAPGRKQKLLAFNPGCSFANQPSPPIASSIIVSMFYTLIGDPNICMSFLLLIKRNKYILLLLLLLFI